MKIGIDINNVLRNTFQKTEQIYQKYYLDDSIESEFDYKVDLPVKDMNNLINHFSFPNKEDMYEFFYEEFPMEIFGHAPSTLPNTFNTLNQIYEDLRDEHDLLIISDEIGKSKPASLFFLSKYGCLIEKVKFFSKLTLHTLWEECDLIITSNPELLDNNDNDKIMVKVTSTYNEDCKSDHEIDNLEEFQELYKILKLEKNDLIIG